MPPFAVQFAIEYGILQLIASRKEPWTAAELAKANGAEELLLIRVLRLLTYNGLCDEVAHGVYRANARTHFASQKAISGGFSHIYHFGSDIVTKIPDLIHQNRLYQFPKGEEQSLMQHTFGDSMFALLSKDPYRKKIFDECMAARTYLRDRKWFGVWPAREHLRERQAGDASSSASVFDIGCGAGQDLAAFRKALPDVDGTFIVEDLPDTFKALPPPSQWITLQSYDFFTPQPNKGRPTVLCYHKIILTES
jgi:hypothetical protein